MKLGKNTGSEDCSFVGISVDIETETADRLIILHPHNSDEDVIALRSVTLWFNNPTLLEKARQEALTMEDVASPAFNGCDLNAAFTVPNGIVPLHPGTASPPRPLPNGVFMEYAPTPDN